MTTYRKTPDPSLITHSGHVRLAEERLRRALADSGWQMLSRESHDASDSQVIGTVLASRWDGPNNQVEFVLWRWLWKPTIDKVEFSLGHYTYEVMRAANSWGSQIDMSTTKVMSWRDICSEWAEALWFDNGARIDWSIADVVEIERRIRK